MRIIILILIFALISCEKEQLNEAKEMAKQTPDIGDSYDDPTATPARDAFDMYNDNFDELYAVDVVLAQDIAAIEDQIVDNVKRVVQIGTWDMDTNESKNVAWTLPVNKSIRTIYVGIFPDSGTSSHYPLTIGDATTGAAQGSVYYNGTQFVLKRIDSGLFDAATFDGTNNRGFITVEYDAANPT